VTTTIIPDYQTNPIPEKQANMYFSPPVHPISLHQTNTLPQILDPAGNLQYIPFPTCTQTNKPLSLPFAKSGITNCTISLTDPLFHLLEFYIHNDAPLTCRLPIYKSTTSLPAAKNADEQGGEDERYVHMLIALGGTLMRSHLHVGNEINAVIHAGAPPTDAGKVVAGTAYSANYGERNVRVIIGEDIPFGFDVRWVQGDHLPALIEAGSGIGGIATWIFGVLVGWVVCLVWIRGWNIERVGEVISDRIVGKKEVLPKYNGYGYGVGVPTNGIGVGTGKRE
jgi:hypothetical protein